MYLKTVKTNAIDKMNIAASTQGNWAGDRFNDNGSMGGIWKFYDAMSTDTLATVRGIAPPHTTMHIAVAHLRLLKGMGNNIEMHRTIVVTSVLEHIHCKALHHSSLPLLLDVLLVQKNKNKWYHALSPSNAPLKKDSINHNGPRFSDHGGT